MLVAPFLDPETGAVMGRVVPQNIGESIFTALAAQERAAGYQIQQEARCRARLIAQYGGTVGGVSMTALAAVGGWNTSSLTEDTDLTCRLVIAGWRVQYINDAECYEEAPRSWTVRRRQLMRWVEGHTECLFRYASRIVRSPFLRPVQKVDLLLHLSCYLTAPVMLAGWISSLFLLTSTHASYTGYVLPLLALVGTQSYGSHSCFFAISVANSLDGTGRRSLLMPVQLLAVVATTVATCAALVRLSARYAVRGQGVKWDKTLRTRNAEPHWAETDSFGEAVEAELTETAKR
jgi:cellulose synthase/poly-beta-1,6-N-acetylglucosamine synthase-like glycosyltransferase